MKECKYAWSHFDFKPGGYAPCFRFKLYKNHKFGQVPDLPSKMVNSPEWQRVREQLRNDEWPDECIDCGVCEPECPEDAIKPDTDEEGSKWVEFNGKWSAKWAVITSKKDPLPDFEKHSGEPGKLEKYFKDK